MIFVDISNEIILSYRKFIYLQLLLIRITYLEYPNRKRKFNCDRLKQR